MRAFHHSVSGEACSLARSLVRSFALSAYISKVLASRVCTFECSTRASLARLYPLPRCAVYMYQLLSPCSVYTSNFCGSNFSIPRQAATMNQTLSFYTRSIVLCVDTWIWGHIHNSLYWYRRWSESIECNTLAYSDGLACFRPTTTSVIR